LKLCTRKICFDILNTADVTSNHERIIDKHKNFTDLNSRDKAFVKVLILTFFRWNRSIEKIINKYSKKKSEKKIINILRIAVTQILFMRTADYSAVNISVSLSKKFGSSISRFVNAILRQVCRDKQEILKSLKREENIPDWIFKNWKKNFSSNSAVKFAHQSLKEPFLDIKVKKEFFKKKNWSKLLNGKPLFGELIRKNNSGLIEELPFFSAGYWWIQSAASTIPVTIIENYFKKGSPKVLEIGSAPGGKTLQLCENNFDVTAVEISKKRAVKLKENLSRTKFNVKLINEDFNKWKSKQKYDCVLIDAPCSGSGVINKQPDILYFKRKLNLENLISRQEKLLKKSLRFLRKNGLLVYSVCSLISEESKDIIYKILENNKDFSLLKLDGKLINNIQVKIIDGMIYSTPTCYQNKGGMDGFFVSCIIKGEKN